MGTLAPVPGIRGREEETAVLADAIDRAVSGRLAVVLIDGEAGIGKTRLLEDALEEARGRGLQVAAGRAADLEQTRPFDPRVRLHAHRSGGGHRPFGRRPVDEPGRADQRAGARGRRGPAPVPPRPDPRRHLRRPPRQRARRAAPRGRAAARRGGSAGLAGGRAPGPRGRPRGHRGHRVAGPALAAGDLARARQVSAVQTHLAHVFAKLDISARAQLAAEVTRRQPGG